MSLLFRRKLQENRFSFEGLPLVHPGRRLDVRKGNRKEYREGQPDLVTQTGDPEDKSACGKMLSTSPLLPGV
jgi:hypothetical protein